MLIQRLVKQALRARGGVALAALLFGLLPAVAHARQLTVTPTVTPVGSLFRYDYTVANATATDISLVSIAVPGLAFADIQNLAAPTGFSADFDQAFGFVNFSESTQGFAAGSIVSGFTFESPFAPTASSFEAFGVDADTGNTTTITGNTLAPSSVAVPEVGSLFLGLTALLPVALGFVVRRRSALSASILTVSKGS